MILIKTIFVRKVCWRTAMFYDKLEKTRLSEIAQSCVDQEFEDVPKKTRKKSVKKDDTN